MVERLLRLKQDAIRRAGWSINSLIVTQAYGGRSYKLVMENCGYEFLKDVNRDQAEKVTQEVGGFKECQRIT